MSDTKKIGVIGGLGPIATAYFYELVVKMTDAEKDQEHIEMLIYSKPSIPDRTEFIIGRSKDSPLPKMIEAGNALVGLGADYIALPCITAHYFHEQLAEEIKAPIIHMVKETAKYLKECGVSKAGIMATEGTVFSGLFQKEFTNQGITPVLPTKASQDHVTDIIYKEIKQNMPVQIDKFTSVANELRGNGAETIVLGCTELSLIKRDYTIGHGFLDAMEVLAKTTVTLSEAKLNKKYVDLIT